MNGQLIMSGRRPPRTIAWSDGRSNTTERCVQNKYHQLKLFLLVFPKTPNYASGYLSIDMFKQSQMDMRTFLLVFNIEG